MTDHRETGQQPSALDKYNADLGRALRAAGASQQPAQPGSGEVVRYRCEPTGHGFWPYCVRAGDGTRELLTGHRKQMELAAAKLNEAFEDGKFVLQSALTAARQRIAELESELETERARGIHTCHDQCQRPLCVAQRRVISLESALSEAVEIMVHGEKLLPKGEARFRAILENKDPT